MGCPDQLAVKQDFTDLEGRLLSQLATKQQAEEILYRLQRVETGTDTTIPGAIANIVESLVSLIRDPIVAAVEGTTAIINNGIDSIENVIVTAIEGTENVILGSVNAVAGVISDGFGVVNRAISATENVLLTGINSVKQVALEGFQTIQYAIASVEEVMVAVINSSKEVMLLAVDRVFDVVDRFQETLGGILRQIVDSTLEGIGELLAPIRSYLEALDQTIRRMFDLDSNTKNLISGEVQRVIDAINGVDRKLGSYPLHCGDSIIPYSGSVADALEILICGGTHIAGSLPGGVTGDTGDTGADNSTALTASDRALLQAIADTVGVNEFPGTVPKSLLNSGDNPEESGTTEITNLPQFILWIVKQVDALIGEFPIKIKITDSDLIEDGNQTVSVELKNIAETLAEIYGQSSANAITQGAQTNFLVRLATEAVATKTAVLITQDLAMANAEFLGYRLKKVKNEARSAFNFSKLNPKNLKNLSQMLQSGEYKYQGFEFDGKEVLVEYLQRLMFAASIIKAVYYRTDEKDLEELKKIAEEALNDANTGWDAFVDEINNPESYFNQNDPDRPYIKDFNSEE